MINWSPSTSNLDGARRLQFGQHLVVEALQGEHHVGEFQRVGHAPDAVHLLDHHELALDRGLVHLLGTAEDVLDDLEDVGVGGQREDQHDQAADAGGHDELVFRMVQVVDEIAEEHRFALLAEAEHDVDLGARLGGHDRAQELHVAGGHFHLHHEVGARQREEQADAPGVEQDGVDIELAVIVVQHRDGKGVFARPVDGLADDVGGLVAIEGRGQHLDLEIDLAPRHAVQETVNRLVDVHPHRARGRQRGDASRNR